ncbi:hypothetical protein GCM10022248_91940 [Nonomuraea soli]
MGWPALVPLMVARKLLSSSSFLAMTPETSAALFSSAAATGGWEVGAVVALICGPPPVCDPHPVSTARLIAAAAKE